LLEMTPTAAEAGSDGAFYEGMFGKRLVTICQEIVEICQLE